MKRFKNILVLCTAGPAAEAALTRALWLAEANSARVTLVDVVEAAHEDMARALSSLSEDRIEEIEAQVEKYYSERLEGFSARFRDKGVPVETRLLHGATFHETIKTVLSGGHDIVLKGAESRASNPQIFAGTDMHLMRKCPCPVWILQPDQPAVAKRIMVAVDPDADTATRRDLNRITLELGTSFADREDAELQVIAAWRLQEEVALSTGRFRLLPEEVENVLAAEEARAGAALDDLLSGFEAFRDRIKVTLRKGFAGEVIPDEARANSIDTIIMGTVGRTGLSGYFIGNTAETILNAIDCSVLTVKPNGFVSPVTVED